jgi:competence protein ComEC
MYTNVPTGDVGYFSIGSLKPHQSPFEKGLMYKGMLYVEGQRVPCSVHHSFGEKHPKAHCDYILHGKLKQRGPYDYLFQAKEWVPVENTWSFAELRFQLKERFRQFLNQKLQSPRVASFLGSLITGDVEDRSLRYEFGRLGLQHILAISGFHFAILIAFCSFFLGLFLPYRWKIIALLLAINAYFLFVGAVPAVQRSWLTAMFYLIGKLIGRHSTGLNLLGTALLIEVVLDPLVSAQLGFQLSFLSCVGILLFHPLFKPWAERLFPEHDPKRLTRTAQHGYLLTSFLRQGVSLALGVNAAILPLILFHFHTFPLLSLFYNLFFPLLVSMALFGLLLSLMAHLLCPPLATLLFSTTDFFTAQILDIASYPPLPLDYSIRVHDFPAWIIPLYLFALFSLSLERRRFLLTNTPHFE